jgi:hypothetical protein
MLDVLFSNSLVVAVLWAAMYIFDYASTLWLGRAYQSTLNRYVIYEGGIELNPVFENEIARRRVLSPRFILALVLYFLIILLSGFTWPIALEITSGASLLTWAFIDLRHLKNYAFVWFLRRRPDSLQGQHQYSYWLMQRLVSTEAFGFALLYFFLALFTWRVFFAMGALTCLALAIRHYRLANRKLPVAASVRQ